MNGVKSIGAEFTAAPLVVVGTNSYQNLQNAFNETYTDATIKALAMEFNGDLILNRDISICLRGGYAGDYIDNSGMTTVKGSLTIWKGTVSINNAIFL